MSNGVFISYTTTTTTTFDINFVSFQNTSTP